MPAIVTDKFRILNTNNFINSVEDSSNSYYIFLGLPNPEDPGFGRNSNWDRADLIETGVVPNPIDNEEYLSEYRDVSLFGKKVTSANVRRVVRRVDWSRGTKYDMYRHDYSISNLSSVTKRSRLYDSNFYVLNSEYKVYSVLLVIRNGILIFTWNLFDRDCFAWALP